MPKIGHLAGLKLGFLSAHVRFPTCSEDGLKALALRRANIQTVASTLADQRHRGSDASPFIVMR